MRVTQKLSRPTNWSRLVRFFFSNVVFALLPLLISWGARQLASVAAPDHVYTPEILFFTVMISATAHGDISDEAKIAGNDTLFQALKGFLIVGALLAVALFGMYQYDQIVGPGNTAFRNNIPIYAWVMAGVWFFSSMAAEVLLVRIQGGTS